jgi:hypothetical protein
MVSMQMEILTRSVWGSYLRYGHNDITKSSKREKTELGKYVTEIWPILSHEREDLVLISVYNRSIQSKDSWFILITYYLQVHFDGLYHSPSF